MLPDYFRTIEKESVSEFKDRGSRFIAYAYPIADKDSFKKILAEKKKVHPKAAHHCFAYRLGTDGNNYRVTDDGEPPGSGGRPILGQIDSRELTNVLIVVVRYFGGTLLGVPGLINAYKSATSQSLDNTNIIEMPIYLDIKLEFDYTRMNDVMRLLRDSECIVKQSDNQLFCSMIAGVLRSNMENVSTKLAAVPGVQVVKV